MTILFLTLSFMSAAAAPRQAEVLKYLPDRNLVGISAGSEEGLNEGDRVVIWRGLEKIAECHVLKTGTHVSFCRIISHKQGVQPQEGDRALVANGVPEPEIGEPVTEPAKVEPAKVEPAKVEPAQPVPVTPEPVLKPRQEELLAVGATTREILVSSTDGVYVVTGAGVEYDDSALPHRLLRFTPWGENLWAETTGGVLLRAKGSWRMFPWSRKLAMDEPAFARVTTSGVNAWGSFGPHVLVWDGEATKLTVSEGKTARSSGMWVKLGKPIDGDIESLLAIDEKRLLLATSTGELLVKEGPTLTPLVRLALAQGDPLLLDLARDFEGTTWGLYFAEGGGLFSLNSRGFNRVPRAADSTTETNKALPPGTLLRLLADTRQRILVLHETEGVFRHSFGTWERVGAPPPEKAVDMAIRGDEILILTEKRLLGIGDEERELFVLEEPAPSDDGSIR